MKKEITATNLVEKWKKSLAYQEIIGFLNSVNNVTFGKKIKSNEVVFSQNVNAVINVLNSLKKEIMSFPVIDKTTNPGRYGYHEFKHWYNWVQNNLKLLLIPLFDFSVNKLNCEEETSQQFYGITYNLPNSSLDSTLKVLNISQEEALNEMSCYLGESFGNSTRIDYGTGHELSFIAFLICLFKLGIIGGHSDVELSNDDRKKYLKNELSQTALYILPTYLDLVRDLQITYRMEPAGSHGVWCLDDFQFVPFYWGSAQLVGGGDSDCTPEKIANPSDYEKYSSEFMMFDCLKYICSVKKGPFPEHSPTLHGISGVGSWEKVNSGLLKMYKAEVLDKFTVVQHFEFGKILPFVEASSFK